MKKNSNKKCLNSVEEVPGEAEEGSDDPKAVGSEGSVENSGFFAAAPLQVRHFSADLEAYEFCIGAVANSSIFDDANFRGH
jgi:hypothetical protein